MAFGCFPLILIMILCAHHSACLDWGKPKVKPVAPAPSILVTPESFMDVVDLVQHHEYPVESHTVGTEDGYLLTLHRIPSGKKGEPARQQPVVLLQHGFFYSSAAWVITGPENGLGFVLADAGYDVWMGNFRGNIYSSGHANKTYSTLGYWDFSWHEMGKYDLPAQIDYVLNATGHQKMFYIGHSTGANVFYIMCALRPDYNTKIHAQFSLSPNAIYDNTGSFKSIIGRNARMIEGNFMLLHANDVVKKDKENKKIDSPLCRGDWPSMRCQIVLHLLGGFKTSNFDHVTTSMIYANFPTGVSRKTIAHYLQCVQYGKYREMDYFLLNYVNYNDFSPKEYDLMLVKVPVFIYYGNENYISTEREARLLYEIFPQSQGAFNVTEGNFSHLDFLWGSDVKTVLYDRILKQMDIYQK